MGVSHYSFGDVGCVADLISKDDVTQLMKFLSKRGSDVGTSGAIRVTFQTFLKGLESLEMFEDRESNITLPERATGPSRKLVVFLDEDIGDMYLFIDGTFIEADEDENPVMVPLPTKFKVNLMGEVLEALEISEVKVPHILVMGRSA
jgi:hypothetical protein